MVHEDDLDDPDDPDCPDDSDDTDDLDDIDHFDDLERDLSDVRICSKLVFGRGALYSTCWDSETSVG